MNNERERSAPHSDRDTYYSRQRSSGRSTRGSRSRTHSLNSEANHSTEERNLTDAFPSVPRGTRKGRSWYKHNSVEGEALSEEDETDKSESRGRTRAMRGFFEPGQVGRIDTVDEIHPAVAAPIRRSKHETPIYDEKANRSRANDMKRTSWKDDLGHRPTPPSSAAGDSDDDGVTALPAPVRKNRNQTSQAQLKGSVSWQGLSRHTPLSRNTPSPPTVAPPPAIPSGLLTEFYTISHLILFSMLGTLARLGLTWLTSYPGAPAIFPVLWANFTGTLILGFLISDARLFAQMSQSRQPTHISKPLPPAPHDPERSPVPTASSSELAIKKRIPLYIGLSTGFCGSLTSFSSFIRDVFLALSNDLRAPTSTRMYAVAPYLPTPGRNAGYSVMAVLAVIILTLTLCTSAFSLGTQLSATLSHFRITPHLPSRTLRKIIDPLFAFFAFASYITILVLAIRPPPSASYSSAPWVRPTLLSLLLTPPGCLFRHYASKYMNPLLPLFPLGTFAVNVLGTAILAMSSSLQHIPIATSQGRFVGGGVLRCQVLQGVMDGFCGAATTVSTFIAELKALRRRCAWWYGFMSIGVGLVVAVVIMGSVRWCLGWETPACVG